MKILAIISLYPPYALGGYEQACRDTVEGLRERGHRVEVLTSMYGVDRQIVAQGIRRVLRSEPFWQGGAYRTTGFIPLLRWHLQSNRYLRALLKAVRPDVVYVWQMIGLPMSLLATVQRAGIPVVVNVQDAWVLETMPADSWVCFWRKRPTNIIRRSVKAVLRYPIDSVVSTRLPDLRQESVHYVSKAFAGIYAANDYYFARERIIYNGIDVSHFVPATRAPRRPTRLLFLSRLNPEKGAHVAIVALALLGKELGRDTATLTVVGDSHDQEYKKQLHALVDEHDLHNLVTFHGAVPRAETAAIYNAHDIFIFPSSWLESFGLVLAEAMACGLPVVGTTPGGSAEILEGGVTGLAIPPEDAGALANGVRRLIGDPALAQRLAKNGLERVHATFDQRTIIKHVDAYLHEVVGAQPDRASQSHPTESVMWREKA